MNSSAPSAEPGTATAVDGAADRRVRADAQRNIDALLTAAAEVFAECGVDAPVRDITKKAGVGTGTLYRHYPQRSDLVAAVYRHEVDACADAAARFAEEYEPVEALVRWLERLQGFFATKRGLASALHSGDPAYENLPAHFRGRFVPALSALLDAAAEAGQIRKDVRPDELLHAVAQISMAAPMLDEGYVDRMTRLLVDGLRYSG
ncbi:MAG TPA: helix-turn-helix domain-containing protein [Actinotalea caeni]|uniref:TetR/AcrR family transcriptional regulator n=1 Tax=Actinotalea caeni TaxID=1348467 RepID=UPI0012E15D83|nr:TetR/AcrR family transcriptional regulator [Actinotalea caeni]HLV56164.1 helix-turn-helix domain-containing protein [Actinotalea caeni]